MNKCRLYDKYDNLSEMIDKIQFLDKKNKHTVLDDLNKIILDYDIDIFDRHFKDFSIATKRRWYDYETYPCLIFNSLNFVPDDVIKNIVVYLNNRI